METEDKLKAFADPNGIDEQEHRPDFSSEDATEADNLEETVVSSGVRPLTKRNEPKLLLSGVAVLLVVFVAYSAIKSGEHGLSTLGQETTQPQTKGVAKSGSAVNEPDASQIGKLKTQVALGSQAQELAKLNSNKPPVPVPTAKPTQIPVKSAVPTPSYRSVSYAPAAPYRASYMPPDTPQIPYRPPVYEPPRYAPPLSVASVPQATEEPSANFVAYGRLPERSNGSRTLSASNADSRIKKGGATYVSFSDSGRDRGGNSLAAEQQAFLSGARSFSVVSGTTVKGKIETPTVAEEGQAFLVKLTDDIESSIGRLPKGSYATARIDKLYGDGLLLASVDSIATPNGQRYSLSNDTLRVMGSNDKPLVAKAVKSGPGLGGVVANIALGAIGNAAGLANQPQTTIASNGAYIQSNRFDMTSALVQGGVNALTPMIQAKQQSVQQDLQSAGQGVRYLKAGTTVKLQAL